MKFFLLFLFMSVQFGAFSQYDFNNFITIQSKGPVPDDFTIPTYEQINKRLKNGDVAVRNSISRRNFLIESMYSIAYLLNSGYVSYGDPVSVHINEIKSLLLKNHPDLDTTLRFYTLKSDETNAFSTDQGVIFVTTGMISQLENDAQLAYILAHEIVHYTEKHVVNTFNFSNEKILGSDWVKVLSQYSREHEKEADLLAIDLYKDAGFSKEELNNVFDILLYSYLPFDEIPLDENFFAVGVQIPGLTKPLKTFPITAREDIDDKSSTHPNIENRKKAVSDRLAKLDNNWGDITYIKGVSAFKEIRTIGRFECLRLQLLEAKYASALYSIYILEHEFPNSIYLKRKKAQCWLGLYQYDKQGSKSQTITRESKLEGESAPLHFFIRYLSKDDLRLVSIRQIYRLYLANKKDPEIKAIYSFLCRELGNDEKFSPDNYASISIQEALSNFVSNESLNIPDQDTLSKYDKINLAKQTNLSLEQLNPQDTARYHLFGLTDFLEDSLFKSIYELHVLNAKESGDPSNPDEKVRENNKKKYNYDHLLIDIDRLLVVDAMLIYHTKKGMDYIRGEYYESTLSEAFTIASEQFNNELILFNTNRTNPGSNEYNQRNTLITSFHQTLLKSTVNSFMVDYTLLQRLMEELGTSTILFSRVDRLGRITTRFTFAVVDLSTGEIRVEDSNLFYARANKYNLAGQIYALFKLFKQNKPQ